MTPNRTVHHLKTWPQFYEAVEAGAKTFEVRKDDRNFQTGDVLSLEEWQPFAAASPAGMLSSGEYTHRKCEVEVTYTLRGGEFVPPGYVLMGIHLLGTDGGFWGRACARAWGKREREQAEHKAEIERITQMNQNLRQQLDAATAAYRELMEQSVRAAPPITDREADTVRKLVLASDLNDRLKAELNRGVDRLLAAEKERDDARTNLDVADKQRVYWAGRAMAAEREREDRIDLDVAKRTVMLQAQRDAAQQEAARLMIELRNASSSHNKPHAVRTKLASSVWICQELIYPWSSWFEDENTNRHATEAEAIKANDKQGVYDYTHLLERSERLVAAGMKAEHVSASECHEIHDGVRELVGRVKGNVP